MLFAAVFAPLLACTPVARSEQTTGSLQLDLKLAREPHSVTALPDPERVQKDSERAIRQLQAQRRIEALIRETVESQRRRPDLSYHLFSGLQSRNLANALR